MQEPSSLHRVVQALLGVPSLQMLSMAPRRCSSGSVIQLWPEDIDVLLGLPSLTCMRVFITHEGEEFATQRTLREVLRRLPRLQLIKEVLGGVTDKCFA